MARAFAGSVCHSLFLYLFILLAACGGAAPPAPASTTAEPLSGPTATPEPTSTPQPTATVAPEPTQTREPTAVPEVGQTNELNQWWDGVAWQMMPDMVGEVEIIVGNGEARATDGTSTMYWVEGQWLTEAQVETRKVVEYVQASSEVINQVPMDWITLRVTRELQESVRSGLPEEEQQYQSPLFAIVTDEGRLVDRLKSISIDVVGYEGKISLGDTSQVERIEFVLLNGNEEPGFQLPINYGHSAVTETQFGAYKKDKTVYIVSRLGDYISVLYDRDEGDEIQFFTDGVVLGLWLLSGSQKELGVYNFEFMYNSPFDSNNPGIVKEFTRMIHLVAVRPEHSPYGDIYTGSSFYESYKSWIPPEFQPVIEAMNW